MEALNAWWIEMMKSVHFPWLDVVAVVLVIGLMIVGLLLMARTPVVEKETICPNLRKKETVWLRVNIFRNPATKAGLDVQACTEFLNGTGKVTCGKECLRNPELLAVHAALAQKHAEESRQSSPILP